MQALKSEGKNSLEPFSKELKIVLLYSIKTVVSHLKMLGMGRLVEDSNAYLVCKRNWIGCKPLYRKRDRKLALLSILTNFRRANLIFKPVAEGMFIC